MVAREGTIAKAGEKLSLAQPTISGQMRALEEGFGQKLFVRSVPRCGRVAAAGDRRCCCLVTNLRRRPEDAATGVHHSAAAVRSEGDARAYGTTDTAARPRVGRLLSRGQGVIATLSTPSRC